MLAQLTALIFNVNRGEKQRPLAASDFMPRWGAAEDQILMAAEVEGTEEYYRRQGEQHFAVMHGIMDRANAVFALHPELLEDEDH